MNKDSSPTNRGDQVIDLIALRRAVSYLHGETRAFNNLVRQSLSELESMPDDRTRTLVDGMRRILGKSSEPNTLSFLESTSNTALRILQAEEERLRRPHGTT